VIQASWQSGSTGFFKVWFDGANQHSMLGTQGTRTWYVDQIAVGTAFADVNPSAW
jgi:hypothetical protein